MKGLVLGQEFRIEYIKQMTNNTVEEKTQTIKLYSKVKGFLNTKGPQRLYNK